MSITRRNTLAILGLTASGVGAEAVARDGDERPRPVTRTERAKMVAAFRSFADALEQGEFAVRRLTVSSTVGYGEAAVNTLQLEFFNKGVQS